MNSLVVFILRWAIPGLLAFTFLLLPDLIINTPKESLASNWIARIFFTVFLSNSFLGYAKMIDEPASLAEELNRYITTDKDTLIIMITLGDAVFTAGNVCVLLYGLLSFFPAIGGWNYLITIFFGVIIGSFNYIIHRMKIKHIKDNVPQMPEA